jgi:hypothetical protein
MIVAWILLLQSDPPISIKAEASARFPAGFARARDFHSDAARLDVQDDLGIDAALGARLSLAYDPPPVRVSIEADVLLFSGHGSLDQDFDYDEGHFAADTRYRSEGRFLFARGVFTWKEGLWHSDSGWLGPAIGVEWATGTLSLEPDVLGREIIEHYNEFVPYPLLGLAGEFRLCEGLSLGIRLLGGYMPWIETPYVENGRVSTSVAAILLDVPFTWRVSDAFRLMLAAQYQYWDGRLHSIGERNRVLLSSPGISLGGELRF